MDNPIRAAIEDIGNAASVPPGAQKKILAEISRRRRRRMALMVASAVAAVPLIVIAAIAIGGRHAPTTSDPRLTPAAANTQAGTSAPTRPMASAPDNLVAQLGRLGYVLEQPQGKSALSASQAITAAKARFIGTSDSGGIAVLYTVTTPGLGTLEDPNDPNSKIKTLLFDHSLEWVVVFTGQMPTGGLAPPYNPDQSGASTQPEIGQATAAIFVDATTGEATRAALF